MKGKRLTAAVAATLAVAAVGAGTAATGAFSSPDPNTIEGQVKSSLTHQTPKNVIFLLGDGMGTQEITAARYYQGVDKSAQRRPDEDDRLRHHLVAEAGRQPAVPARL